ncbi:putative aminoacyltransferase, E1 ubiquitin-activating enzyme [Medicago truncatula]|uniref:RING-type E3 ubiquitin transferase n=1 Tax=Medicago truncatula TaxID=3880 RepID=G7LAU3_MEDTR|nr:U-box domain-containing protein 44 [Medicago truncatula]AET02002.2 spotted leaf protein, putative [Medicago truncatula]RHN39679.1 putative aminoacyltransferase, E1 ubiquitin-activating enzyme [Medicago truncatula]
MMVVDFLSSGPTSTAISQIIETIGEFLCSANDVLVNKDSFKELSSYLERIAPILKELRNEKVSDSEAFNRAIDIMNRETKAAKLLAQECGKKSRVYLLMNCRSIVNRLENHTKELSKALGLLPLSASGLSAGILEEIKKVCDNMEKAGFKAAVAEEEILEKIESGIRENSFDRKHANNLINLIAKAVGITNEKSTMKAELEEFKKEIENARVDKKKAEAMQMDQIIALLERADAASSPNERKLKYFAKRQSLGTRILEPLQSFYCSITHDVMVEPVETSSDQTFERSAIEKWFEEGNKLCPLTLIPLDTSVLRPNKTLKQSIEEWKDRNTMITIATLKEKIHQFGDDDEVISCLKTLEDLCEQREQHREWMILEDYIQVLIQILGSRNRDIRNRALVILCVLAKDNEEAKERIVTVDNAIESIVHSLGRRQEERKLAVALLLELSKYDLAREHIGKVQGCILLLVTMSNGDDNQAARDATEVLDNLSYSDQNVILMAKANYFKHLLQRLSTGADDVKMIMAKTLAEMELTDHNKESLFVGGVLAPLLHLFLHNDLQVKTVATKALKNLSSLNRNGLEMIRQGAVRPLLDLLYHHSIHTSSLWEDVAAIIMQLAASTISQDIQTPVLLLDSDDDVFNLFPLISVTQPGVQQNIIQTFYALCQSPSSSNIKTKLNECSAIPELVRLCESENLNLRASAIKLFSCLVESCDESIIVEHVDQKCINTLLQILQSSSDDEEILSAMGIICHLPEIDQITQWILDAGVLPIIYKYVQDGRDRDLQRSNLVEKAVGALRRFTVPTHLEWQKIVAETGIITVLVQLLESGSTLTKQSAALCLAEFSKSSVSLSRPIPKQKGLLCCFSAPSEIGCKVHGGVCTVKSSFCLLAAEAIGPLTRNLGESDYGVCEASLDALLTLIEGEKLESGGKVLAKANAIPLIIKFLSSTSLGLQEKSLHALERIFQLAEFKQLYGASAQMPLVDLTQRSNGRVRSMSARVLAHLNVLHDQSSYF